MSALQPPKPGVKLWETPHGVKMRMPTAHYPYYRLDYRLGGVRRTPGAGKDWQAAWAEAIRLDALVAAAAGLQADLTVTELAEAWFKSKSTGKAKAWKSERHKEETRRYLDSVILPSLGAVALSSLELTTIEEMLEEIDKDSVERKVRAAVGSMAEWGFRRKWLQDPPEQLMPEPRNPQDPDDEGSYIDPAEIPDEPDVLDLFRALQMPRQYASKHATAYTPPEWMAMMPIVAACTGARQGECFALKGKNVNGRELFIAKQVQLVAGTPKLVLPKMGRTRTVIVSDNAFGMDVRAWVNERAAEVGPEGLLFPTPTGKMWRRSNYLADSFTPARMAAWGSLRWSFHSLRHHAATRMLQLGIDINDVALMMGHKHIGITQRMYISHQASAFDRISERI
jgi:integrase